MLYDLYVAIDIEGVTVNLTGAGLEWGALMRTIKDLLRRHAGQDIHVLVNESK